MRTISKPLTLLVSASAGLGACETTKGSSEPDSQQANLEGADTGNTASAEALPSSGVRAVNSLAKNAAAGDLMPNDDAQAQDIKFTLGSGQAAAAEQLPEASTKPLSPEATQALLDRAPGIKTEPEDAKGHALREGPVAPDLPGVAVEMLDQASGKKPKTIDEAAQPAVLRMSPEGEVALAPRLSVTFATPMVALASIEALREGEIPAKLSPNVEGTWRWLGTKTLIFEAKDGRLPMATDFTFEVPKGVKDAEGRELKEGRKVTFQTPAPEMVEFTPNAQQVVTQPIILVRFNQKVSPEAIAKVTTLHQEKNKIALRLATPEELSAELKKNHVDEKDNSFQAEHLVALTPVKALATNTSYEVKIASFTGLEGPRPGNAASWTFQTYDKLKVESISQHRYGGYRAAVIIQTSNPLDCEDFKPALLKFTPEVKQVQAYCSGSQIVVQGAWAPETTYKVEVSAELKDQFSQKLGSVANGEFTTAKAEPELHTYLSGTQTLDPAASKRQLRLYSTAIKEFEVKIRKVAPKDYADYLASQRQYPPKPLTLGEEVFAQTMQAGEKVGDVQETLIDLSSAIPGEFGHALVSYRVVPTEVDKDNSEPSFQHVWVQATKLGVDAFGDAKGSHVWVNDLTTGLPVEGAEVRYGSQSSVKSNNQGIAWVELANRKGEEKELAPLIVSRGDDVVVMEPTSHPGISEPTTLWWVVDAQKLYRPGETVRVKGALRHLGTDSKATPSLFKKAPDVQWVAYDAYRKELAKGTVKTSNLNSFDFEFKLPATPNLGHGYIEFKLVNKGGEGHDAYHSHSFRIEEFRKPDFELSVAAPSETLIGSQKAAITANAKYFAGGVLANSPITWSVSSKRDSYTPPNHSEFTFGERLSWWRSYSFPQAAENHQRFEGKTDAQGQHVLDLTLNSVHAWPVRFNIESTVSDTNNQSWSSSSSVLVHPSELYVGLKPERWFGQSGQAFKVDAVVVDVAGQRKEGVEIHVEAKRIIDTKSLLNPADAPKAEVCVVRSGPNPVTCTFNPTEGGNYEIRAIVKDAADRQNETKLNLWVNGPVEDKNTSLQQQELQLIPGKERYQPGETAEISVVAPFKEGEVAVMVVRNYELVELMRVSLTDGAAIARIPIEEWMIPNLAVNVFAVGPTPRSNEKGEPDASLPPQPAYARGDIQLKVGRESRELKLTATPDKRDLAPGQETTVRVQVKDALGKAVENAEVAVFVVDEALLALVESGYTNPLDAFYPETHGWISTHHNRSNLLLARLGTLYGQSPDANDMGFAIADSVDGSIANSGAFGGARSKMMRAAAPMMAMAESSAMAKEASAPSVAVRADFSSLATFFPKGKTNAQGQLEVPVKLPDSLTRYRIITFAFDGSTDFGMHEDQMVARLPLSLRVKAPRFLNFGDRFELSVQVQNLTENAQTVDLAARVANLSLSEQVGRQVVVPAHERVEIRIPVSAAMAGTGRLQVVASSEGFSDAQELNFPVWTPATTEAFATYGEIDGDGAIYQLEAPKDVIPDFGGLELETSSTQLQSLTDALIYLNDYFFDHTDALTSRILSISSLKDVLSAFKAKNLPSPEELTKRVSTDLELLKKRQLHSGAFSYWYNNQPAPFLSVHVTHALIRAQEAGFAVDKTMLEQALAYLKSFPQSLDTFESSPQHKRIIEAYALYVRQRMGETLGERAKELIHAEGGFSKAPLEMVAWLYPVFKAANDTQSLTELRRVLSNRVSETADAAHFTTSYTDGAHLLLHSERRVDAILLEGLIADQPQSDLIPKLVRGLIKDRVNGHWSSLQTNTWSLIALERYFRVYEDKVPNFVSRAWVGSRFAGEHTFRGRTREQAQTFVPTSELMTEAGKQTLTLSKTGTGRMYYRLGLRYAPTSLEIKPESAGFTLERRYEAVDDAADVTRDEQGRWIIKEGARVKVSILMHTTDRRYNVVLADWLPAGLEPLNASLKGSEQTPKTTNKKAPGWRWFGTWYDHEQLRDERAEAYTSLLWEGVHTYEYVARATTRGTFVAPPAKAEEIYSPETFGRTGSEVVIVK